MRELSLERANDVTELLCVGAHSDDIEIGCGAAILSLLDAHPTINITWVVFSASGARAREARQGAEAFLTRASRTSRRDVVLHEFRDGYFPNQSAAIKDSFEQLKKRVNPDVVFTHFRDDRHQDHRVLSELAWNTFRNHFILEYEIPKYDGDLGSPNVFVPVSEQVALKKAKSVCSIFRSQAGHHWFTEDVFLALMRIRGVECCSPSGYAEAFYSRKVVLSVRDGSANTEDRRRPRSVVEVRRRSSARTRK
jgi:LmbE family N-acetylglucosaminyl deacetylase